MEEKRGRKERQKSPYQDMGGKIGDYRARCHKDFSNWASSSIHKAWALNSALWNSLPFSCLLGLKGTSFPAVTLVPCRACESWARGSAMLHSLALSLLGLMSALAPTFLSPAAQRSLFFPWSLTCLLSCCNMQVLGSHSLDSWTFLSISSKERKIVNTHFALSLS